MIRYTTLLASLLVVLSGSAQQMALDWATPTVPTNHRVKFASNGDVFAMGRQSNSVLLQRFSSTGLLLWTKTLSAPTLQAIDMDVDASDNLYIAVGFTTGQLDLDPGPNTTLVDPGKAYAKYNSSGQFQWGFCLENGTDLSDDYCALSCDDAGNLYICGDLGAGTYDFDPGAGVDEQICPTSSTGSYSARYHTDGTLAWSEMQVWPSGTSNSRDIAVMRDGSSFYMIRVFDNNFPGSQIDVDPGPNVVNVYCDSQNLMRYDSTGAFIAQGGTNYYRCRLAVDANGDAYVQSEQLGGMGATAWKYTTNGSDIDQVYSTSLYSVGSMKVGDLVVDEQGGCLGMYTLNCSSGTIRFYKMNVSGLVDFNQYFLVNTDCTYPFAPGFDLDGTAFIMGTFNNGHAFDYDPGVADLTLPGSGDGVVARYEWCAGTPYDPFDIFSSSPLCLGDTATFTVDAFGDASSYTWAVDVWPLLSGQGTGTITVLVNGVGSVVVSVTAENACGSSAPYIVTPESFEAIADLGPDQTWCYNFDGNIGTAPCAGCSYSWSPGGETTASITVAITQTTTYTVTVNNNGCQAVDAMSITIDPCLGVAEVAQREAFVWPVPVASGEDLHVEGLSARDLLGITGVDGRVWPMRTAAQAGGVLLDIDALPAGSYALRTANGRVLRFVVG